MNRILNFLIIGDHEIGKTGIVANWRKYEEIAVGKQHEATRSQSDSVSVFESTNLHEVDDVAPLSEQDATSTTNERRVETLNHYTCDNAINGMKYCINIKEVASFMSGSRFTEFREQVIFAKKKYNAIILCFSLFDINSLNNIENKWYPELRLHYADVPIILVGTKTNTPQEVVNVGELSPNQDVPLPASRFLNRLTQNINNSLNSVETKQEVQRQVDQPIPEKASPAVKRFEFKMLSKAPIVAESSTENDTMYFNLSTIDQLVEKCNMVESETSENASCIAVPSTNNSRTTCRLSYTMSMVVDNEIEMEVFEEMSVTVMTPCSSQNASIKRKHCKKLQKTLKAKRYIECTLSDYTSCRDVIEAALHAAYRHHKAEIRKNSDPELVKVMRRYDEADYKTRKYEAEKNEMYQKMQVLQLKQQKNQQQEVGVVAKSYVRCNNAAQCVLLGVSRVCCACVKRSDTIASIAPTSN